METKIQPKPVLGFTPPKPLRKRAMVTVWADTAEAFEKFRARLVDLGHEPGLAVYYSQSGGSPFSVLSWTERDVICSMHGPMGYKAADDAR